MDTLIKWVAGLWRVLTYKPCTYANHDLYSDMTCPVCGGERW